MICVLDTEIIISPVNTVLGNVVLFPAHLGSISLHMSSNE